ncbi:MAG: hypothetical protein V4594_23105 [Bacteroidota bacterium]
MKKKILISYIFAILFAMACKKDDPKYYATTNLNVVNAAVGAGGIKVNSGISSGFLWSKTASVAYGASALYGATPETHTIIVVPASDTTKVLFNKTFKMQPINTLYFAGQYPNIDTLFRVEHNLPVVSVGAVPDDSMYIRFVNLSPNSPSLSINLKAVTSKEINALDYKSISEFKKYSALATTSNYVFEVRNATTNLILTSFTVNVSNNRYRTLALVIKGLVGASGADALSVFQVSYI